MRLQLDLCNLCQPPESKVGLVAVIPAPLENSLWLKIWDYVY